MKKLIALFLAILIVSTGIAWFTSSRNKELKEATLPKEITVYSTVSNNEMQFIANSFKEQTGITVNYKIVSNLQQAVEQNKGNVDLVYGGTSNELNSMASAGLLEKTNLNSDSDISSLYKGENGYWYGTSIEPIVMFYNPLYTLAKDAPKTWSDLVSAQNKGKVILNPEYQDYLLSIAAAMNAENSADNTKMSGQTFENQLNANDAVAANNQSMYVDNLLNNKERSISFAPMNEVQALNMQGHNLTIVNPTAGSPLVVQGAAVVNGSKNLSADDLFMEFVAGPKMQLELAQKFNVIPVSKNALSFAPTWMKSFNNINITQNDWNLLNDGQFEAYNKNNPQAAESKTSEDKKSSSDQKTTTTKTSKSSTPAQTPQQDPLSQPNGAIIQMPSNAPLTTQEQAAQNALNQLQQQPSQVFTTY